LRSAGVLFALTITLKLQTSFVNGNYFFHLASLLAKSMTAAMSGAA